ncbi:MAG: hypothetical protein WKF30_17155 [Pyrinomonadaceae bacterium]
MAMAAEVTTKEAAQYLGVTVIRVLQLIKSGQLVADKKGTRDYWVTAESLQVYKNSPRKPGKRAGMLSEEPAVSSRFGTGTAAAEREREYQRDYKRRMRGSAGAESAKATASSKSSTAKKKSSSKKTGTKR